MSEIQRSSEAINSKTPGHGGDLVLEERGKMISRLVSSSSITAVFFISGRQQVVVL